MKNTSKILIALLIFIVVNVLGTRFFLRYDFTQGQVYTLSDATNQILQKLPDGVEIRAYISKQMPAQFANSSVQLKDKLNEYQTMSKGKLKIVYADPVNDKDAEKVATQLQIPALDLQVVEKDQMQVVKAYFGIAILKQGTEKKDTTTDPLANYDKKETIPVIQDMSTFEYDLGAILLKMSSDEQKVVAFTTGHGEKEMGNTSSSYGGQDSTNPFRQALEKNYTIKDVDLSKEDANLDGVQTLIVVGPRQKFEDGQAKKIEDFIAKGGNTIFMIDSFYIDTQSGLNAISINQDFTNLIGKWGLKVDNKMLVDASSEMATFNQGYMTYSLPYPFFVKAVNLDKNNSITRDLESFVLPWVSPLQVEKKDGIKTEVLAYSSSKYSLLEEKDQTPVAESDQSQPATIQKTPISIDPQQNFGISKQDKQTLPLVVQAQKEGEGKVILIGDADMLSQNFAGNGNFFMNAVDAMTLGDTLIKIRSKGVTDRPIKQLSSFDKDFMRWGLTIGIPLIFIIYGFLRRANRKNMKKSGFETIDD